MFWAVWGAFRGLAGSALWVLGGFGGDNALRANADLGLCRETSRINP